jgi:uncharacterized protein
LSIVTELLWALRRAGLLVSTAEALDLFRAFALLGFDERGPLREATVAVLAKRPAEVGLIEATFDRVFRADAEHGRDSRARLAGAGLSPHELATFERLLRDMLTVSGSEEAAVLLAVLAGGPEVSALTQAAWARRLADGVQNSNEIGYFAEAAARGMGVSAASKQLAALRGELARELGEARAEAVLAAFATELSTVRTELRGFVAGALTQKLTRAEETRQRTDGSGAPFVSLSPDEEHEVLRAVLLLAQRLRAGARVRLRHQRRGPLDARQTVRRALRTGGVPLRLWRRVRRPERPRLWVLCDVSDSVRGASTFLLAFVKALSDLFAEVRAFVFVGELVEVSALVRAESFQGLVSRLSSGLVVSLHESSHYGRALASFEHQHARNLGKRDVVVILGDGRTNHRPAEAERVARLRDRAKRVVWLCPEPVGSWGVGDSAMRAYAAASSLALPAVSAADLEVAARRLIARR